MFCEDSQPFIEQLVPRLGQNSNQHKEWVHAKPKTVKGANNFREAANRNGNRESKRKGMQRKRKRSQSNRRRRMELDRHEPQRRPPAETKRNETSAATVAAGGSQRNVSSGNGRWRQRAGRVVQVSSISILPRIPRPARGSTGSGTSKPKSELCTPARSSPSNQADLANKFCAPACKSRRAAGEYRF